MARKVLGDLTNTLSHSDESSYKLREQQFEGQKAQSAQKTREKWRRGAQNQPGAAQKPRTSTESSRPIRPQVIYENVAMEGCRETIPKVWGDGDEDMCESFRMVWDAATDLCQLWVSQCADVQAPNRLSPWLQFVLSKFGRCGPPGLVNVLMRPRTGTPPKPPSAQVPKRPPFMSEAADAATHSQLQELLADGGLLLGGCHQNTEKVRPSSEDIYRCISAGDRQQSVLWMAQVCAFHGLDESVLFLCVTLLDRYCASSEECVDLGRAHRIVIAVFRIALKVIGAAAGGTNTPEQLRFIAEHICQDKFSKQDMARAELEVLEALGFDVAGHSLLDFLDSFLFSLERPKPNGMPSALVCVATFLMQLALGDASLLHRYPYAALAAGAVYVGLWCTQASSDRCQRLLQDATEAMSAPPLTAENSAANLVPGGDSFTKYGYVLSVV